MKRLAAVAAILLLAAGCAQQAVQPETPALPPVPPPQLDAAGFDAWLQGERARLADQREAARTRYAQDELACWRRFAVNDCLRQARLRQRAELQAARRDELALDALERDRKTEARLRAIEEKAR